MHPKLHFLTLLVLLTFSSFSFSFGRNQKDPLPISIHETYGWHNPQEYPTSSLSAINHFEDRNGKPKFQSLLGCESSHSFSPPIFNVDDFGAKGDGRDDRKVS